MNALQENGGVSAPAIIFLNLVILLICVINIHVILLNHFIRL